MAAIFVVLSATLLWVSAMSDWLVAYATRVTQLAIWVTIFSLLPFAAIWVSLKVQPFAEYSSRTSRAHWSVQLKV